MLTFANETRKVLRDIEYAVVNSQPLALDFYPPASHRTEYAVSPLIVWIHGGAWRSGSKNEVPIEVLTEHGFAIASVNYRLSPQAKFPAQIHDIKAAIRFLRGHAADYRIDPDKFVIAGASAGGHLAALVGVTAGVDELEGKGGEFADEKSSVQAIVSFYGASNLQSILAQSTEHGLSVRVPALELLLGGQPNEKADLARLASPVAHVDSHDPPLWLIHGDADPQMPPEQSTELEAAYRSYDLQVSLEFIAGAKHGGAIFFEKERLRKLAHQLSEAINDIGSAKLR